MDGGRGGRHGYHGSGGRHHRNRRGGGRGRGYRHQPYNNRSRGPRHGRSNRFGAGHTYQDPQTVMIRQVSSFVSRVGEFKNLKESQQPDIRAVVATTATNINDLTAVLCAEDKLEMLLKFQGPSPTVMTDSEVPAPLRDNPSESVGKLVHVVVSCAAGLPLQTPCYAALTVAVHERVKGTQYEGFADRCVQYAVLNISRDLDSILLLGTYRAQALCRAKLLLRYLAILGKIGVVKGYDEDAAGSDSEKITVWGMLRYFVEAASAAGGGSAFILCALVLSTTPYIMDYVPVSVVSEKLMQPMEALFESYRSSYSPGIGMSSILLKDEQLDEDDDADDDDDDDSEDDEFSGQICDSLQDLLRASQRLAKGDEPSKFCLPVDAPWLGLSRKADPNLEGDDAESHPVSFSDDPIYLCLSKKSQAVERMMQGENQAELPCLDDLEGIVFGRLPIFGSAPDPEDSDEEDNMAEEKEGNESLKAFVAGYTFLDRYFVAETLRDCLISHESYVSPTGVQHGSAKATAEELLSVHNIFSGENSHEGSEYAILETIFALIAQSGEQSPVRRSFLSSVLLELTRLEPSRFSPALAVAMTNLFQDYLPALVPAARDSFSRWFAFHLINTDYQWPGAFWKAWAPYTLSPKPCSRGSFVRRTLHVMADNVSNLGVLRDECLAATESLSVELLCRKNPKIENRENEAAPSKSQVELNRRLWETSEDPSLLLEYVTGDEFRAVLGGSQIGWSKVDALVSAIANPARLMGEGMENSLKNEAVDSIMVDDPVVTKDVFAAVTDAFARYKETILSVLRKEAETISSERGTDKGGVEVIGESFVLRAVERSCYFSSNLLEGAVACLVQNNIVSAMGVARWALGDLGDEAEIVPRWWVHALDAAREQMDALNGGIKGGGMIIDGAVSSRQAADASIEILCRLLHYSIGRVCTMLVALQTDEKRLNPSQVDLLEGTKDLVYHGATMLISRLTTQIGSSEALTRREAQARIRSVAEMSSVTLSNLCTGYESNKGVSLLRQSLLSASCIPK